MRLQSPHCPRCGAQVEIDATKERATCAYCGTTSYVARADRGADVPVVVVKTHVVTVLALAVALIALLVAGALLVRSPTPTASLPPPMPRPVASTPAPAAEPAEAGAAPVPQAIVRVTSLLPARLSDVDGDRTPELVVSVRVEQSGTRGDTQVAVFDATTGALRARTPALEDLSLAAVWRARLVLAQTSGQLTAYDLVSGDVQWTTALGERVAALCAPPESAPDTLHVTTDDGRTLSLALTTGRQSETKAPCQRPLAIAEGRHSPRDRRDLSAPPGVEAYRCGGVRVLSHGYAVPDACRTRAGIASDRLPGMVGHRVWRHGAGFLIFGVRTPGTYVPMVGRYERGRFRWKSEVPLQNPLEVDEGGPAHVELADGQLVLAYASSKADRGYVTMLAADDGRRLWTTDLGPRSDGIVALRLGPETVVAQTADDLMLLDRASGQVRTRLSETTIPAR